MQSMFEAAADDRTQAELTTARLISNAYRTFTVAEGRDVADVADYVEALRSLGVECVVEEFQPPARIVHGKIELTLEQRKSLYERQVAEAERLGHQRPSPANVATSVYGKSTVQDPARVRVRARWVGQPAAAGAEDLAPRGRRLGLGKGSAA